MLKKKKEPCSVSDGQKYGGDERKERTEMESFEVGVGENFDHASLSWWQFKCSLSRSRCVNCGEELSSRGGIF